MLHARAAQGRTAREATRHPPGTYEFIFTESPKLGYVTPLLEAVPDFDEIRIHKGNFPSDTEGCILVGKNLGTNAIYSSGEAFSALIQEIEPGTIEIVEQPAPPVETV